MYALLAALAVSLVSFTGLFVLSMRIETLRRVSFVLVSLAVGALLGEVFIHIIPELFSGEHALEAAEHAHEHGGEVLRNSLLIIGGIIAFFGLERTLHWHHHGHDETEHDKEDRDAKALGKLVLVSDGIHNLLDGMVIGAAFMVDVQVGIATTIAVMLHEIPQEIGDFGVLVHAGYSKFKALFYNFVSALTSLIGVAVVFAASNYVEEFSEYALPVAAGMFLYIATSDLVPELHKKRGFWNTIIEIVAIGVGIFAMYLVTFVE